MSLASSGNGAQMRSGMDRLWVVGARDVPADPVGFASPELARVSECRYWGVWEVGSWWRDPFWALEPPSRRLDPELGLFLVASGCWGGSESKNNQDLRSTESV